MLLKPDPPVSFRDDELFHVGIKKIQTGYVHETELLLKNAIDQYFILFRTVANCMYASLRVAPNVPRNYTCNLKGLEMWPCCV